MTEKLKNLLSDIVFENEFSSSSLQGILKSCNEYQNFANKDAAFINQINTNLSANINVEQNHLLLNTLIQQCSEEVLTSNAISWMSFCIKSTDSVSASIQCIDYNNLYLLITKTQHSNDVKKQFVASILPKFILKLDGTSTNHTLTVAKLQSLEKVLKHYNGPCFSQYKSIERFLLQCIETWHSQDTILFQIGLCYALLAQLGGGGHQTSMYRDNWQTSLCKLVKYAHEVLDKVFEDVPEIQTVPIPDPVLALDVSIPLPSYYPNTRDTSKLFASQHLLRTFKILSILMQTHLAAPFPAPKTINIEAVLSVVARTLSISPPVLNNLEVTSGHAITLSMLPDLHTQAHAILSMLITIAGRNLIPHSLYICKLTVHTLKGTNTEDTGRYSLERPFRVLRCAAYHTLHKWLILADYSSNIELMAEELVGYILADIIYDKPPVTLTTVKKMTRKKHKTKVGLEAEKRPVVDVGGGAELREREGEESVCSLAHIALVDVLRAAGMLLKPDLLKNIQTQVAGLLLPLCTGAPLPPYTSCFNSRHTLYRSVEALLLYTHPMVPDLSHYATVFFHAGLNDAHLEIRHVCQRGIELLEKIHHPKADSLNFVMENLEEEKLKLFETLGEKSSLTNGVNGVESESDAEENKGKEGKNKRKRKDKPDEVVEEDERRNKKLKKDADTKSKRKGKKETQVAVFNEKKSKQSTVETSDESDSDSEVDVRFASSSEYEDSDDIAMMNMMVNGGVFSDSDESSDESDDSESDDSFMDHFDGNKSEMSGLSDDDDDFSDSSDSDVGLFPGFRGSAPIDLIQESSDTESEDSREGVVITEIVDEETTVVSAEATVDVDDDNVDVEKGSERNEARGKKSGRKNKSGKENSDNVDEEAIVVSGEATVDVDDDNVNEAKDSEARGKKSGRKNKSGKKNSDNVDEEAIVVSGKATVDVDVDNVNEAKDSEARGKKSGMKNSEKADTSSKNKKNGNEKDEKESDKENKEAKKDVVVGESDKEELVEKDGKDSNADIEMIDLDESSADGVEDVVTTGEEDVEKADTIGKGKVVEKATKAKISEEITLSSDSNDSLEDVVEVAKKREVEVEKSKESKKVEEAKRNQEVRIESEEDEEVDDCLKLFSAD